MPTREDKTANVLKIMKNNLTIERPQGTYIVDVSFQSKDPQKAARIANAFANAYIHDQVNSDFETRREATEWMKTRLADLRQEVNRAGGAVVEYKSANGIATASGVSIADNRLADLSLKLSEASAASAEKKARLDRIVTVNNSDNHDLSVPDALTNDVIISLRKQYFDMVNLATELADRYGNDHHAVEKFRRNADNIRKAIRSELQRIEETYRSDYEIALMREQALRGSIAEQFTKTLQMDQKQVGLHELQSAEAAARMIYDDTVKRYIETAENKASP